MEATANKAIIYDDTCPLCVLYTGAFVKTGMLKEDNRISFNELAEKSELTANMDLHRSKHEIPLVDLKGGETLYGLDSLVFILSQKMPFIVWFLQFRPIRAFFKTLYNIVSFNRRVIVGAAKSPSNAYDCTPDFHIGYRITYIALATLIGILGFFFLSYTIASSDAIHTIVFVNFLVLWTAVIGSGIYGLISLVTISDNQTRIEYFGQLATIGLMGLGIYVALMSFVALIPTMGVATFGSLLAVVVSFGVVCRAHFRRLKVVGLGDWRLVVWVLSFVVGVLIVLSS